MIDFKAKMFLLVLFAMFLAIASPASAGTKWTHDKEGAGAQKSSPLSIFGSLTEMKMYWAFAAVEDSNWITIQPGMHFDFCVTAAVDDEAANGASVQLLASTLGVDEPGDVNYSIVVQGATLTGVGSNSCIRNVPPGKYLGRSLAITSSGVGLASVITSKSH